MHFRLVMVPIDDLLPDRDRHRDDVSTVTARYGDGPRETTASIGASRDATPGMSRHRAIIGAPAPPSLLTPSPQKTVAINQQR